MSNLSVYQPQPMIAPRDLLTLERQLGHIEHIRELVKQAIKETAGINSVAVEEVLIASLRMRTYEQIYAPTGLPFEEKAMIERIKQNMLFTVEQLSQEHCRKMLEVITNVSYRSGDIGLFEEISSLVIRRLTG